MEGLHTVIINVHFLIIIIAIKLSLFSIHISVDYVQVPTIIIKISVCKEKKQETHLCIYLHIKSCHLARNKTRIKTNESKLMFWSVFGNKTFSSTYKISFLCLFIVIFNAVERPGNKLVHVVTYVKAARNSSFFVL